MNVASQPSQAVFARALSAASRAPSVANSQPWLWRLTRGGLELFADRSRRLVVSDPDARSLLISCGATLHHLQAAMAAEGWASDVVRLPDDRVPGLLASIQFSPRTPSEHDMAIASAIANRKSDRRPDELVAGGPESRRHPHLSGSSPWCIPAAARQPDGCSRMEAAVGRGGSSARR